MAIDETTGTFIAQSLFGKTIDESKGFIFVGEECHEIFY